MASYYEYEELRAAATAPGATHEQINALGEWLEQHGDRFWNGECYDADGYLLFPIYDETEPDEYRLTGYELRRE